MIFISYSSRDYDTARTIKKVLESNGKDDRPDERINYDRQVWKIYLILRW